MPEATDSDKLSPDKLFRSLIRSIHSPFLHMYVGKYRNYNPAYASIADEKQYCMEEKRITIRKQPEGLCFARISRQQDKKSTSKTLVQVREVY